MGSTNLNRGLPPTHPGEVLREDVLPALGISKTRMAELLGISRQTLYDIIDERASVTPAMALKLGKLCGNGARLWLNLQNRYDLDRYERELSAELEKIPTLTAA